MSNTISRATRARRFILALLVGSGLVLSSQAIYVGASAASVQWVDGGDDSPCLNDDTGKALTELPTEYFCTPIVGCYQGDDGKWVLPSRKTGIWQGNPADVRYADEIVKPTPKPTTPKPTTPKPTTPTKNPVTKPTTPTNGVVNGGGTGTNGGTEAPAAEVVPPGAPTAPAAPTVTVKGSDVTVTWLASPNAALETVTGYTLQFTDAAPVQLPATTFTHTFTGLKDGNYRAAVQAVNAAGPSLTSAPSEVATVGTPITEVVGEVVVDGDLVPGGTVTVTGTKFAKDVPELSLELHSDPVVLGTVATDAKGAFTTTVTIPATVEAGDHSLVVLYDGDEITNAPVKIAETAAVTATDDKDDSAAAAVKTVPPYFGLAILAALGAAGALSLVWHVVTGRRRRARNGFIGQQIPAGAAGVS